MEKIKHHCINPEICLKKRKEKKKYCGDKKYTNVFNLAIFLVIYSYSIFKYSFKIPTLWNLFVQSLCIEYF